METGQEQQPTCQPANQQVRSSSSSLVVPVQASQWPIVYSAEYNFPFGAIERLQSYDLTKSAKIFSFLVEAGLVSEETVVHPNEVQEEDLLLVHPKTYLDRLKSGQEKTTLGIDLSSFVLLPDFLVLNKVLKCFRFQTGGTVLAARLALDRGWAINVGGGFHHCCATRGGGFCPYADMTLAVKFLFETVIDVRKIMIIDLSAHQGNGLGRDFLDDERVYILDIYNREIYPHDGFAKRGIRHKVELRSWVKDEEYLQVIRRSLDVALGEFEPDLVMYNAGSDVLVDDHTGGMLITPEGIIERDQIVFVKIRSRGIPLVMVTGGGYHRASAHVVAHSIVNLHRVGLISNIPLGKMINRVEKKDLLKREPDSLEGDVFKEESSKEGLWTRFKSFSFGNSLQPSSAQSELKDRRSSLNFSRLFPKADCADRSPI